MRFRFFKSSIANFSIQKFYTSNLHFGHSFYEWNPRIIGSQHLLYKHSNLVIFNLNFNSLYFSKAIFFIKHLIFYGGTSLLVDHDRLTRRVVKLTAEYLCQPYLCSIWSGGTLTNFREVVLKNLRKAGRLLLRFRTKQYVSGLKKLEFVPNFVIFSSSYYSAFAVKECNILNIPSIGLLDSNVWASEVFFPIFGNDDALTSVKLVFFLLAAAFRSGRSALILNYFGLISNFILRKIKY